MSSVIPVKSPLNLHHASFWRTAGFLILALLLGILVARLPIIWSVAMAVGSLILLLILIQPMVAIALALFAGPIGALENVVLGTSIPESGQILFFLAVSAWLARGAVRKRIWLPRTKLTFPLALFLTVAALSLLDAYSLNYGLKEFAKWFEMGLVMLMVVDLAAENSTERHSNTIQSIKVSPTALRSVVAILLVAGLSQAIIGIWQFGFRGDGPEHFEILDRFYRAYGTFEQPNPFGGYMAITASLALGVLAGLLISRIEKAREKQSWLTGDWLWTGFIAVCCLLSVGAMIASWSRGAWLGFGFSMAIMLLFLPRRRWLGLSFLTIMVGLLLLGLAGDYLPSTIVDRLGSFRDDLRFGDVRGEDINDANYAVLERLAHWQAATNMAKDNLLLGVGFGNYEPAYNEYALLNWPYPLGHAHNYYLNIVAETGVLGALTYLVFWVAVFVQAIRILRRKSWPNRGIALGLLAAWTALAAHHLVDKLYVNNLFIFMGVMLGLQQLLDISDDKAIH